MLEFYSVENGRVLDAIRHDYITDHRPDGKSVISQIQRPLGTSTNSTRLVWFQPCEVWEIKGKSWTITADRHRREK